MDDGDSSLISHRPSLAWESSPVERLNSCSVFCSAGASGLAATDAAHLLVLVAAGAEEDRALMFYTERMAAKSVRRKG
ncbi:MAG: hypothetical protein QOC96_2219 [Acidobacteriota bacterium]|jgi:hypothetical protein|nr:hypothetical protein [Acidobacteriota bacterium]